MKKQKIVLKQFQRDEIINSSLSNLTLAEIYDVDKKTISQIRIKAGKGLGRGCKSADANNKKLTPEQMQKIISGEHRTVDLANEFGVTKSHISRIKTRNGVQKARAKNGERKPREKKRVIISRIITPKAIIKKHVEIDKSEKLKNDFKATTKWKLQNGWSWQKAENRSMVLRKN